MLDDQIQLQVMPGGELDMRGVLYLGARTQCRPCAAASDVRLLGGRVAFTPELLEDLAQFGFGEAEMTIAEALRAGGIAKSLIADRPEAERRLIEAVTYALAAWTTPQGVDAPTTDTDASDSSSSKLPPRNRTTGLPPTRTIPPPSRGSLTPSQAAPHTPHRS